LGLDCFFGHPRFLQDYKSIYGYYVEQSIVTFDTQLPSDDAIIQRLISKQYPYIFLQDSRGVIGYSYLYPHGERQAFEFSVNYGVYLDHAKVGRGYGFLLSQKAIQLAKLLGYASAFSGIALPNAPSHFLQEKLGFVKVGDFPRSGYKLGQWIDVRWFYMPLITSGVEFEKGVPQKRTLDSLNPKERSQILSIERGKN
jgi:L-amino acid N-acyltransferase YncA